MVPTGPGSKRAVAVNLTVGSEVRTTEGGPPITEGDVAELENKLKISLPQSYRDFLLRTNGGCPERDLFPIPGFDQSPFGRIQIFLGIHHPIGSCNLDQTRESLADRIPNHLLVIASTGVADEICMSLAPDTRGSVYYWDGVHVSSTYGTLYLVANSFEEFLERLYSDELSPKIDVHDVN